MSRELDAAVAMTVMGWTEVKFNDLACTGRNPTRTEGMDGLGFEWVPRYSTDIAAAWLVVEAMRAKGWDFALTIRGDASWEADFDRMERVASEATYEMGDTAPEAICRAALSAIATTSSTPTSG